MVDVVEEEDVMEDDDRVTPVPIWLLACLYSKKTTSGKKILMARALAPGVK